MQNVTSEDLKKYSEGALDGKVQSMAFECIYSREIISQQEQKIAELEEQCKEMKADLRKPIDVEMDGKIYRILGPADASGPHINQESTTFNGCKALFWYNNAWHSVKNTGIKERLRRLWDEHYEKEEKNEHSNG